MNIRQRKYFHSIPSKNNIIFRTIFEWINSVFGYSWTFICTLSRYAIHHLFLISGEIECFVEVSFFRVHFIYRFSSFFAVDARSQLISFFILLHDESVVLPFPHIKALLFLRGWNLCLLCVPDITKIWMIFICVWSEFL